MTFGEFLSYLQGPGVGAVVGAVTAVLAEYWPWFQSLPDKARRIVYAGMCLVVPVGSVAVGCWMGYQSCGWDEAFWPAIYQGALVAFGIGTAVVHNLLFLGKGE